MAEMLFARIHRLYGVARGETVTHPFCLTSGLPTGDNGRRAQGVAWVFVNWPLKLQKGCRHGLLDSTVDLLGSGWFGDWSNRSGAGGRGLCG